MRNKSLFLSLACVCGTVAAIGVSQWMNAQATGGTELAMVEIFVTTKTIDQSEEITPDKIRLEEWPADRVPSGSCGNLEEVQGKFARQRFFEGEPIMTVKLMDSANGSSQSIPVGFTVVSMRADPESSVASLVRPGDTVDVMAYFTKGELIPESMAKTVLTGVRVFAVDGRTDRETTEVEPTTARSISLLIHKNDAQAWTYASELGKIRLSLGNPGDNAIGKDGVTQDGSGQEFLKWLADHQAAQAEREANNRKTAVALTQFTPAPALKPPPTSAPKKGFKMLKMSGGVLTEYFIEEGSRVPVVISESGGEGGTTTTTTPAAPAASPSSAPTDYSYLNGSQSPFYQPGGIRSPGDRTDLESSGSERAEVESTSNQR